MNEVRTEKVKKFLKEWVGGSFLSEKERWGLYLTAIEEGVLHPEDWLSKGEVANQRASFDRMINERIREVKEAVWASQQEVLNECYKNHFFSPQFHWNPLYKTEELADTIPHICISDLVHHKFVICAATAETRKEAELIPGILFIFQRTIVVKEYPTIEALVRDGWRLA